MPAGAQRPGRGKTTDALRDTIDRGRTGEKVPIGDPAAAPLGTDDEAAGVPPDPERVAQVEHREAAWAEPSGPGAPYRTTGRRGIVLGLFVALTIVIGAILLVAALLGNG